MINFIKCTEEECEKFAKAIENGDVEYSEIQKLFDSYKKRKKYKKKNKLLI